MSTKKDRKTLSDYDRLYVPRMFAQHPFPTSDKHKESYFSVNGNNVLIIESGRDYSPKDEKTILTGLPFGTIPRILILAITTKVVLTQKRQVNLSKDISGLLKLIEVDVSGGKRGSLTQFYKQLKRLLSCRITYQCFRDIKTPQSGQLKRDMGPISELEFWETRYSEKRNRLKDIQVKLHEHFYQEVINNAFPVDPGDVDKLRQSPFKLDLYLFLSHRVFNLKEDTYISWKSLNKQFGSNYANHLDFGRRARKYLKQIKAKVYKEVNFEFEPGRLVLKKSPTPVKKLSTKGC
ncbi:replication protein RepA [Fodinibius halophilus]|uniref:Plasmid encoded RepA protein n=1 Tax=Fodinibius halophilus TaxID=1736908 RepID=A0A6M1T9L9_9BACT|nr:replication protein RepA [Fodinibius halophilus]NGP90175.1 hypothetical protein [Fodinibius halophilus]